MKMHCDNHIALVEECQDCQAQARESMRRAVEEGRVEAAPQDEVGKYPIEVERVLDALGFPEAWVTDMSSIADFCLEDDELIAAGEIIGFPVSHDDLIFEVAKKLKEGGR